MKPLSTVILLITVLGGTLSAQLPQMANGFHDLRVRGGSVKLCAYCHTPHVPSDGIKAPLWSRAKLSTTGYDVYTNNSGTLNATQTALQQGDANNSAMCMSCHDGSNIFSSTAYVKTPQGLSRPTLMLGGNFRLHGGGYYASGLSHTHPVNFVYDDALANSDGALYKPSDIRNRLPLYGTKLQCGSCHDPHAPSLSGSVYTPYFLRVTDDNGTLCVSCHIK